MEIVSYFQLMKRFFFNSDHQQFHQYQQPLTLIYFMQLVNKIIYNHITFTLIAQSGEI